MSAINRLPIVCLLLIAANILAAFVLVYQPHLAVQMGFHPADPRFGDAAVSMFLHQNLIHLLGNMVFLAAVGAAVEVALGSLRFSLVYFLGGFAGILVHWLFVRQQMEPPVLIGASGAVASCVAYYSVRYAHLRVPLAPGKSIPLLAVVGIWLILQVAGAFVSLTGDTITSYWSHLGGFACGLLLSVLFRAPKLAQLDLGHQVLTAMNQRSPGAAVMAADLHLQDHPDDVKALREKGEALARMGDCEGEVQVLLKLLDSLPEMEQADALNRLHDLDCLDHLSSLRRTLLAERFKAIRPPLSVALLESVVQGEQDDPQRPEALLALAGLELQERPERAQGHLSELISRYPMHPAVELARTRGWAS